MGCLQGHPSPPGGILWRHQPATERKSVNGKRRLDIENGGGAFEVARGVLTACCPLCKHKAVGLLPPSKRNFQTRGGLPQEESCVKRVGGGVSTGFSVIYLDS